MKFPCVSAVTFGVRERRTQEKEVAGGPEEKQGRFVL